MQLQIDGSNASSFIRRPVNPTNIGRGSNVARLEPKNSEIHIQLPQRSHIKQFASLGTQTMYRESSIQTDPCSLGTPHKNNVLHSLADLKYKKGLPIRSSKDIERINSFRKNWIAFKNLPDPGDPTRLPAEKKLLEDKIYLNSSLRTDIINQNRTLRHSEVNKQINYWSDRGDKVEKERLSRLYQRKDNERLARHRQWNRYKRKEFANFESKNNILKGSLKSKISSRIDKRVKGILDKMEVTFAKAPSAKKQPMIHKFIETDVSDEEDSNAFRLEANVKEDRYDALLNSAFDDIMKHRYKEVVDNYRRASVPTDYNHLTERGVNESIKCDDEVEIFLNQIKDSSLGLMFNRIVERLTDLDECDSDTLIREDLEGVTSTMIDNYIESLLVKVVHKLPDPSRTLECESDQRSKSGHAHFNDKKSSLKALKMRDFQKKCLSLANEIFWDYLLNIRKHREVGKVQLSDPIQLEDSIKRHVDDKIWKSNIYEEMEKAFSDIKISQEQ